MMMFRYLCLSAEQATTLWRLAARLPSIQLATACSHGHRSASVSGMPACILAILAAGWRSSASSKSQCRRPASSAATVVLPEPDTPMTTRTEGAACTGLLATSRVDVVSGANPRVELLEVALRIRHRSASLEYITPITVDREGRRDRRTSAAGQPA